MTSHSALMLNASNLNSNLTYPYAFVQVSEIADRHDIEIIRRELFGIQQADWADYLQGLLDKNDPEMILITLRNIDSGVSAEYEESADTDHPHYFPAQATQTLIDTLRERTDLKIAVGGFGFSIMAERVMEFARPDYGVTGEPDDFFEKFEWVLEGKNLDQVANLHFWEGNRLKSNPRTFFPPAQRGEYTEAIIREISAFHARFAEDEDVTLVDNIAIEDTRGCPHRCRFCSEPVVKGHKLFKRDLDAIRADIELVGKHGFNKVFFTCSELNPVDNGFATQIADLIIDINRKRSQEDRITWYASYMMTFSPEELEHLKESGFRGGWYDVISLDDENLESMQSPYSREELVRDVLRGVQVPINEYGDPETDSYSQQERILANKPRLDPGSFFLGNPTVTVETVRETVRVVNETGLAQVYENTGIVKATRVYDFQEFEGALLQHTWSRLYDGKEGDYCELYPSFSYPPALIDHFGDAGKVVEFFDRLGSTFLSSRHLFEKRWGAFLGEHVDRDLFASWWAYARASGIGTASVCTIPDVVGFLERPLSGEEEIGVLFDAADSEEETYNLVNYSTHMAIRFILLAHEEQLKLIIPLLGLSGNLQEAFSLTSYETAIRLFGLYESKEELIGSLSASTMKGDLARFCAEYLLYLHNVPLEPNYREFFVQSGDEDGIDDRLEIPGRMSAVPA